MVNQSVIQEIIDDHFYDQICDECMEYINNFSGADVEGDFDCSVDYIDFEGINYIKVLSYGVSNYDNQIEVSGDLEIEASISGHIHWDGENMNMGYEVIELSATFSFYINENKYEDFELTDLFI